MTLTETGSRIALIDANEAKHEACRLVFPRLVKHLTTTRAVWTEAMYLKVMKDLADASPVAAAAETLGLRRVFTLDRLFYAYRRAGGSGLEVMP